MKNAELAMSLRDLKKKGTDVSGTKVKLSEADSRIPHVQMWVVQTPVDMAPNFLRSKE